MSAIADQKAAARKAAFARRKAAHEAAEPGAGTDALLAALAPHRGGTVSAYWPIHSEIDPRPALYDLAGDSRICLPVIEGKGLPLAFREWTPGCEMITGAFGAAIPAAGETLTPDVVIVPMVAFDARLYRLGYGGGFYDRTLEGLRAKGTVTAIGFAYAAQEAHTLPIEPTDQPLDLLVTEAGIRGAR